MDALNIIARMLKIQVNNFGFSGTKDRRAATVQRISIQRQREHNIKWLNSRMPGVRLGDFKYSDYPIQLGQHAGNEFIITLKNCHHARGSNSSLAVRTKMIEESVVMGLLYLSKNGFLNYFGLQRFGTHSIGTHELGMKILRGDFEGAVEDILHVDPQAMSDMFSDHTSPPPANETAVNRDEQGRARAIASWRATGNAETALGYLPKRFGAETSIIRHLGRESHRRDYMGALLSITKGMRQMYIHAYQSYVWNFVASRRWAKYGPRVIEGDLILLENQVADLTCDDDSRGTSADWENFYAQVRPLTAEDIAGGKYTIFDIVLPTPGFDVTYPKNDIGEYYKVFMSRPENGGLDPYDMRRRQKEFSLSGNYRPLVGRFLNKPEYLIRTYSDDNEQMSPTDIDIIMQKKALAEEERKRKANVDASSVARWQDFAQNPVKYDDVQEEEARRRRAAEPPNLEGTRINETWVQTGVDGSDKRIKVARHQFESVDFHDETGRPHNALTSPIDEPRVLSAPTPQEDAKDTFPFASAHQAPTAVPTITDQAGASLLAPSANITARGKENDSLFSDLDDGVGAAPAPPGGIPMIKAEDVDPPNNAFSDESFSTRAGTRDRGIPKLTPMDFRAFSSAVTTPTTASAQGQRSPLAPSSAGLSPNGVTPARLTMPEFKQLPENPFDVFRPENYSASKEPRSGHKTAVLLKFQLRSSSYATIVLRELMGTVPEEVNRSSRGSTPGFPVGGPAR